VTGLAQVRQFHRYHRVLSRAAWLELGGGRVVLERWVAACVPTGPLLFGIDDTLTPPRQANDAENSATDGSAIPLDSPQRCAP
jgi:hypothetical protein